MKWLSVKSMLYFVMTEIPAKGKIHIINVLYYNICNCFSCTVYHTRQFCLRFHVNFLFILTVLPLKTQAFEISSEMPGRLQWKPYHSGAKKILNVCSIQLFQYLTHCRSWDLWLLCLFKNGHVKGNCQFQTKLLFHDGLLEFKMYLNILQIIILKVHVCHHMLQRTCGHQGHDCSTTSPVISMEKLLHVLSHKSDIITYKGSRYYFNSLVPSCLWLLGGSYQWCKTTYVQEWLTVAQIHFSNRDRKHLSW